MGAQVQLACGGVAHKVDIHLAVKDDARAALLVKSQVWQTQGLSELLEELFSFHENSLYGWRFFGLTMIRIKECCFQSVSDSNHKFEKI